MGRDKARHLSAWLLTVSFELAAGIMTQLQAWITVTILFWAGIACLVFGYFPEIRARFQTGKIFGFEFLKQAVIAIVMASAVY